MAGNVEAPPEPVVRDALDKALAASRFSELAEAPRGLRTPPAGYKSEATFDRIVETAAQVLDDVPLRDITTHLVADKAEVNIATLYRYFADLEAILLEFSIRWHRLSLLGIHQMVILGVTEDQYAGDRRRWVDEMIDLAVVVRTDTPGAQGITRDAPAMPGVLEVWDAAEEAGAHLLAIGAGYYAPGLRSEKEWREITLTQVRAVGHCLVKACSTRPADLRQIELTKDLAYRYFVPFLEE